MTHRISRFITLLLAYLLLGAYYVQAQTPICDNPPTYHDYVETGHGVGGLHDMLHTIGHLLLVGWWLLAAGLVVILVWLFRRSLAAWVLMWLPLPLVLWVALPPLRVLYQRLEELQYFLEQCGEYIEPGRTFDYYKRRHWEDASPYIIMLAAMALLYVGVSIYLIKFRRGQPASQPAS